MFSWRERLCGTVAMRPAGAPEIPATIRQMLQGNDNLTCGGGFYPVNLNKANMTTFRQNFILPTNKYSILVFRKDGDAVIYSEEDEVVSAMMPPPHQQ